MSAEPVVNVAGSSRTLCSSSFNSDVTGRLETPWVDITEGLSISECMQIKKQLSNLNLRKDKLNSDARRHEKSLNQYKQWQQVLSKESVAGLQRTLVEQGETLTSIFPEASRKLPRHLLRAEVPAAQDSAVREAQDGVAKARWTAAKTAKVGERMVKVAKSADERAYADRMLKNSAEVSKQDIQRAEHVLDRTKEKGPRAYMSHAVKKVAGYRRAWHQHHKAAAELRLGEEYVKMQTDKREQSRGGDAKHTKKVVTRGNIRTHGAAVKRAVRDNYAYERLEKEQTHRRWAKEGRAYVDGSHPSRLGGLR